MEEKPFEYQSRIDIVKVTEKLDLVRKELKKVIVGQENVIDMLLVALLSNGHVLLEGVPGVAKTLLAKLFSRTIDSTFSRIQFTPDLMPSDILGTSVFDLKTSTFNYKKGPIFANIVLIDEINRAPAKTQAALFEVMEERQITIDGQLYPMERPFLIVATQNPIEHEGTYRLPEAQLDRFMLKLEMSYPSLDEEIKIITFNHQNRLEQNTFAANKVITGDDIIEIQRIVLDVIMEEHLIEYIARIVKKSRESQALYLGASPRASIAIMKAAKAYAVLKNRDFVIPEDIAEVAVPVMKHRVVMAPAYELEGQTTTGIIRQLIDSVAVPR